ncbi:MAG TPA: B12-binding domain-containing radical SAM protein [Bacteroidetes bacterium]|nr:B12-binding domain-containing radical SAM protein [Bacteroidota bacterium]
MDILLTHGFFLSEDAQERRVMRPYPPLGILYLSAYLKLHGVEARVFDSTFSEKAEFERYLERERPPIVGIYCNLMTKLNIVGMIRVCKKSGAIVVLGGPEPPSYLDEYLSSGADVVVIGEGEVTLLELVRHLSERGTRDLAGIQGIAFRDEEGRVVTTAPRMLIQDLDALPLPDREAISVQAYQSAWKNHHGQSSISLITARGCPYTCTWCSHGVYGFSHRRRSPESVVREIERLQETYRPDLLWIADDVFTINHGWLRRFREELHRRNIRIRFECISRADRLSEDVLSVMAELGCTRLWLGSESGSQKILDAMKRGVRVEEIRTMTAAAQRLGIDVGLFVMLGYEGETAKDIEATIEHLKQTRAKTFLTTLAYPIKGTAYHQQVEARTYSVGAWDATTDRDRRVRGRYSDRFYWFAQRHMVNEVFFNSAKSNGAAAFGAKAAAFTKSKIARLGMLLTQWERS